MSLGHSSKCFRLYIRLRSSKAACTTQIPDSVSSRKSSNLDVLDQYVDGRVQHWYAQRRPNEAARAAALDTQVCTKENRKHLCSMAILVRMTALSWAIHYIVAI